MSRLQEMLKGYTGPLPTEFDLAAIRGGIVSENAVRMHQKLFYELCNYHNQQMSLANGWFANSG